VQLLLATQNPKKVAELAHMLGELDIEILTPRDVGGLADVIEDQDTFAGNARKKACAAALQSGLPSLADDSGLEVDALDGAPGVHSARFAGQHGDDAANNSLLLEKLAGLPSAQRGAHFTCALALADSEGKIAGEWLGKAHGRILENSRGTRDFGYDPLFLFTEEGFSVTGRGFAELDHDQKSQVSHRGRALRQFVRQFPLSRLSSKHG
jgi:XTP/dITP diphosphohydrolase